MFSRSRRFRFSSPTLALLGLLAVGLLAPLPATAASGPRYPLPLQPSVEKDLWFGFACGPSFGLGEGALTRFDMGFGQRSRGAVVAGVFKAGVVGTKHHSVDINLLFGPAANEGTVQPFFAVTTGVGLTHVSSDVLGIDFWWSFPVPCPTLAAGLSAGFFAPMKGLDSEFRLAVEPRYLVAFDDEMGPLHSLEVAVVLAWDVL